MKREYDTIEQFYNDVKSEKIDESKLEIILDNDSTFFYYSEDIKDKDDNNKIVIRECNGHNDIEPLYKLLFKKADVQWC